jgi:hypothetical protein
VKPTNKLRWLTTPEKRGTFEEVQEYMGKQGCSYWYALATLTVPKKRVLQQWWQGGPGEVVGEWRNIEEVTEK